MRTQVCACVHVLSAHSTRAGQTGAFCTAENYPQIIAVALFLFKLDLISVLITISSFSPDSQTHSRAIIAPLALHISRYRIRVCLCFATLCCALARLRWCAAYVARRSAYAYAYAYAKHWVPERLTAVDERREEKQAKQRVAQPSAARTLCQIMTLCLLFSIILRAPRYVCVLHALQIDRVPARRRVDEMMMPACCKHSFTASLVHSLVRALRAQRRPLRSTA